MSVQESRLKGPLRRPLFRRLLATYAINEMGDWMGIVALSVLVFEATNSPLATAGLFLGTRFLPAFLGPVLVTRVERLRPRIVLPVIYAVETAAFGALALLASNFSLTLVIIVATVDGTMALAGRALTRSVVVSLLEPTGELRQGNGLLNIAFTAGAAVGPALAGLVVAGIGVQAALFLNAASFYIVALIIVTAGALPRSEPEEGGTWTRVKAGVTYLRKQARLRRVLVAQGLAFIFFSAVAPLEVIYAKETLGASDTGYGILLTTWGVGMVGGSLIFTRVKKTPLIVMLLLSTVTVGISYLGMGIAPTLAVACAFSVLGGVGNGVEWVSAISAVQELTESGMQARIMAVLESVASAMPGVGFALGGVLAAVASTRATFAVSGFGVLAIALLIVPLARDWHPSRDVRPGAEFPLDESHDVVLELLPGGMPIPNSEVEL
ncbi:MAG TPA: MFS transporter [Solirubrobacterales bacterium]|jgi:predicted MFS family arabinose efflux permease